MFQVATYFLFLGDLFIVCIFAISFTTAYRFFIHFIHFAIESFLNIGK